MPIAGSEGSLHVDVWCSWTLRADEALAPCIRIEDRSVLIQRHQRSTKIMRPVVQQQL